MMWYYLNVHFQGQRVKNRPQQLPCTSQSFTILYQSKRNKRNVHSKYNVVKSFTQYMACTRIWGLTNTTSVQSISYMAGHGKITFLIPLSSYLEACFIFLLHYHLKVFIGTDFWSCPKWCNRYTDKLRPKIRVTIPLSGFSINNLNWFLFLISINFSEEWYFISLSLHSSWETHCRLGGMVDLNFIKTVHERPQPVLAVFSRGKAHTQRTDAYIA
jgi:hypothetical protein